MIYFLRGKDGNIFATVVDIGFDDFAAMDAWEAEIAAGGEVVVREIRVPDTAAGRALVAMCAVCSEQQDSLLHCLEALLTETWSWGETEGRWSANGGPYDFRLLSAKDRYGERLEG
jgi:hypothetical protein